VQGASLNPALQVPIVVSGAAGGTLDPNAARNAGVLHRSAIAAADTLALPGTLTLSDINEAGSTLANVAYHVLVSAGNRWGPTGVGADPGAITPTATHAVRCAFAQVAGADYYDIFLSTAVNPLWVGRITEAQRATGDQIISTVGVVSARAGATVAGTIDIGIVGTGLATNVNPFVFNNAYTPDAVGITAISCVGYNLAHLHAKLAVTDLRSLPACILTPWFADETSATDWFAGAAQSMSPLIAVGQVLEQDFVINVDGSTGLKVLVQSISGQGAAFTCWVELA
jgi:hypothetical protein